MRVFVAFVALAGCEAEKARPALPPQVRVRQPPTRFGLPVEDRLRISARIGVDHDPVDHKGLVGDTKCSDYVGRAFPWCYDEHTGTDLILAGGFEAMDAGSMPVLAAYGGEVLEVEDGHYDRCHVEVDQVSCDGNPIRPNYVAILHPDGLVSLYYHVMKDSILVAEGDLVECGDPIALIGSSGNSSMPHLHFEVQSGVTERILDPFAGPFSQDESLWEDQGPDTALPGDGCTEP
jgi:murein DD-endopeptidase MepM/ murein hydrolase activator NlpD